MKLPRIALFTFVLGFVVLLFLILVQLRFYLVPAALGALLAMLMLPLNRKLERWGCHRILAITISLIVILAVFIIVGMLFTNQVMNFTNDLPTIQQQLKTKFSDLLEFIATKFGVSVEKQTKILNDESDALFQSGGKWIGGILLSTGGALAGLGLIIIHMFLFLLYRNRIKTFFLQVLPDEGQDKADNVIEQITKVTQKYLTGVVIVTSILAVLNSIGLLALGIPNAIFFGILAAVLNVIPYIGIWIGSALPILMAIITKDSLIYPLAVGGLFLLTQFVDNNFLTPHITGSQVKINALAAIGIIIVGGMVWGIGGMILFVPLLGMLKIIFDNVKSLKPYGYLIGDDDTDEESHIVKTLKKISGRKKTVK